MPPRRLPLTDWRTRSAGRAAAGTRGGGPPLSPHGDPRLRPRAGAFEAAPRPRSPLAESPRSAPPPPRSHWSVRRMGGRSARGPFRPQSRRHCSSPRAYRTALALLPAALLCAVRPLRFQGPEGARPWLELREEEGGEAGDRGEAEPAPPCPAPPRLALCGPSWRAASTGWGCPQVGKRGIRAGVEARWGTRWRWAAPRHLGVPGGGRGQPHADRLLGLLDGRRRPHSLPGQTVPTQDQRCAGRG